MERNIVAVGNAHHYHAGHPEEEDVVAGLHDRCRVEVAEVFGLVRPAEGGMCPQRRAEPGIKDVRVLLQSG
ncbi:hypothetical protein ES703_74752 [subsurface metagenome]